MNVLNESELFSTDSRETKPEKQFWPHDYGRTRVQSTNWKLSK